MGLRVTLASATRRGLTSLSCVRAGSLVLAALRTFCSATMFTFERYALWIYEQRELCLCLGHPQPPLSGTGVLWVSCRDPPVCHDVQGDIVTERQPLCVVLVLCCC